MKFLVDVCADSRPLRNALLAAGHDVLFASERFADAADEALLAIAWREGRVLITHPNPLARGGSLMKGRWQISPGDLPFDIAEPRLNRA